MNLREIIDKQIKYQLTEIKNIYDKYHVACMSWLYFISEDGKLTLENWLDDNRMGVTLKECLPYLEQNKLIKIKDGIVYSNNKDYIESILLNYFMVNANNSLTYYQKFNYFNKYTIPGYKGYPINEIPLKLYKKIIYKNKPHNIPFDIQFKDFEIKKWFIDKYQKSSGVKIPTKFENEYGHIGSLVYDKTYTLFRGVYYDLDYFTEEQLKNIRIGKTITSNKGYVSFTNSFDVAKDFAFGKSNYSLGEKQIPNDKIGFILVGKFPKEEILIDTDFVSKIDEKFEGDIMHLEHEVIVSSKKRQMKIFKIYEPGTKR